MGFDFLATIDKLNKAGKAFAIATVVRAEKPTSAKPGAKAVITADGSLSGWIGGSCAEPTVKREARKALEDGQSRLVRLCPPEKRGVLPQEGVVEVPMTCISGGTLEIFIEPQLAQPHLVVIGHHAIVGALAALGKDAGFRITVMGIDITPDRFPEADRVVTMLDFSQVDVQTNTWIVIASHGNYDEDALTAALQTSAVYVALVASKRRTQALLQYLRDSNLPEERLASLKAPAGLDLGAITPEEIAVSILAEIIQRMRRPGSSNQESPRKAEQKNLQGEARDPVCGMMVEIAGARHVADYNGQHYYFCTRGCQLSFDAEPERYLSGEENHGR